jgi:hypothetical protein
VFERIHCSGRIHCSFDRFIGKFDRFIDESGRYLSVMDFTVHILNQIDFGQFLSNFTEFSWFFQKTTGSKKAGFFNLRQFFLPMASLSST